MFRSMVLGLLAGLTSVMAQAADYKLGPAPAWVTPIAVDASARVPEGEVRQGVHYLLVDQQVLLDAQGKHTFRHMASRALNERRAETVAHVEIGFDPSFQTLTLHAVDVLRDGLRQPRLRGAAVKVLQRESQLESRIYDGAKTANLFLEDIRAGDVVEVAYTLRGSNPIFGGRESGWLDMQWSVPVAQLHRSLTLPADRPLKLSNHLSTIEPTTTRIGRQVRHVWTAQNLPALARETQTPSWYDPFPGVAWSQFEDWADVARWAEPLYRTEGRLTPLLQAEARRIAGAEIDDAARLLAVLRFVQREVRYLGIEIGPGSHEPREPELVFRRRYGDCKDKTLLTITLLRSLGISAHAALVETRARGTIREFLPSPNAFNHVIVRAMVGGKAYWLDPTREPQAGSLDSLSQAPQQAALVLDGVAAGLSEMPKPRPEENRRRITHTLDAGEGFAGPVRLVVETRTEAGAAERLRDTLRNEDRASLQRDYLNFYARHYPGLVVAAPMQVNDDEASNQITLVETYEIPNFWQEDPERRRMEATVRAPDIRSVLREPDETVRKSPFALLHPERVELTIQARLPEEWNASSADEAVSHPAFGFNYSKRLGGRSLKLNYQYESRKDHVSPDELQAYLDALERTRDWIGITLYHGGKPKAASTKRAATPAPSLAMAWVVALAATLAAAVWARGGGLAWGRSPVGTGRGPVLLPARKLVTIALAAVWLPTLGAGLTVFLLLHSTAAHTGTNWVGAVLAGQITRSLMLRAVRLSWPTLALSRCADPPETLQRLARRHSLWMEGAGAQPD